LRPYKNDYLKNNRFDRIIHRYQPLKCNIALVFNRFTFIRLNFTLNFHGTINMKHHETTIENKNYM